MTLTPKQSQRLVSLSLLGALLFSFPLMALFNLDSKVFGVPLLYVYLFGAWAALIALMALVVERSD